MSIYIKILLINYLRFWMSCLLEDVNRKMMLKFLILRQYRKMLWKE